MRLLLQRRVFVFLLLLRMSMPWSCFTFDVDQAFVRADLEEDVFMRLPEGCGALSGKIAKLNKI